jgi:hypothetical protein
MSFQHTLLRLAMIDEGFIEHEAGLALGLARVRRWIPRPHRCFR